MKYRNVLFALIVVFSLLALVTSVSADENDTLVDDNTVEDFSTPQIDIEQSYEPHYIEKGDTVSVYLIITNVGNETYYNINVHYYVPSEFDILIYPSEYKDGYVLIDSLYPGERNVFTFITKALVSNATATFEADIDGEAPVPMDVYIQPDTPSNSSGDHDYSNKVVSKAKAIVDSHSTGNPILMLLFAFLVIPLFFYRRN